MLRILARADAVGIRAATGAVAAASVSTGLTWPFFLLAWRAAFWIPMFVVAACAAAREGTALSYAVLAFAAVIGEVSRRDAVHLWADSRKEWDHVMFSRYALAAFSKRSTLAGCRLICVFWALAVVAIPPAVMGAGNGLEDDFWTVIYLSFVLAAGGWIEAATPPLPGTGEREISAVPEAA